jgi:uncharacterized protein (DUF2235 family)
LGLLSIRSERQASRGLVGSYPAHTQAGEVARGGLGVFDTVGALGIPLAFLRRANRDKYEFHDVELSSIVDVNLHALALDEHREPFEAALWRRSKFKHFKTTTEQVWFPGAHADVGGGYFAENDLVPRIEDVTLRARP